MTVADIVNDVINHLTDSWNSSVCDAPEFMDGLKKQNPKNMPVQFRNYIRVYDAGTDFNWVDPNKTVRDEFYNIRLVLGSNETGLNRNNILSETERILNHTGITGYDNRAIVSERRLDDSVKWETEVMFLTIKYNQSV